MDRIPQFWDWLVVQGGKGKAKLPREIYKEISVGTGNLVDWLTEGGVKEALLLGEEVDPNIVRKVLLNGYQSNDPLFSDTDVKKIGCDAVLIAYAMSDSS